MWTEKGRRKTKGTSGIFVHPPLISWFDFHPSPLSIVGINQAFDSFDGHLSQNSRVRIVCGKLVDSSVDLICDFFHADIDVPKGESRSWVAFGKYFVFVVLRRIQITMDERFGMPCVRALKGVGGMETKPVSDKVVEVAVNGSYVSLHVKIPYLWQMILQREGKMLGIRRIVLILIFPWDVPTFP